MENQNEHFQYISLFYYLKKKKQRKRVKICDVYGKDASS